MQNKPRNEPTNIQSLSYEQAFEELETILEKLENERSSLEETLALFERGKGLVQHCAGLLDEGEYPWKP